MSEKINVGQVDSLIRKILGFGIVGLVIFHFIGDGFLSIFILIPLLILIPFFLKTGFTKVCPIMKALNLSSVKKIES